MLDGSVDDMLDDMVGEWLGTTTTWFEPGVVADESETRATVRAIGAFLLYEYHGSVQGAPMDGIMLLGVDEAESRTVAAWTDTFHMRNGLMFCKGDGPRVRGEYAAPPGPPWGWRTEFALPDPDHLVVTAYNIEPGGREAKAVETRYARVVGRRRPDASER